MMVNYQMIVDKYPKPCGVVGNFIPGRELFSLLDRKTSQVATRLLRSKKEKKIHACNIGVKLLFQE
jgi:hypothetical protein